MLEGDSIAVRIMMDLNVNPQKLYNEIVKIINEDEQSGDVKQNDKDCCCFSYICYNINIPSMNIETQMNKKIHHGRNIKRLREMLGIKQEAIAMGLNIT